MGSAPWRGGGLGPGRLDMIGEDSDSSGGESDGARAGPPGTGRVRALAEEEEEEGEEEAGVGDVPQCFSHFSYEATEGRHLVCDLQVPLPRRPSRSFGPKSNFRAEPTLSFQWNV